MTALALFALAFTACLAGAAAGHWWVIRPLKQSARDSQRTPDDVYRDAAAHRARRIADTQARLDRVPAAPDNTEGVNRSDWDDCELILAATRDIENGLDQLFTQLGQPRKEDQ